MNLLARKITLLIGDIVFLYAANVVMVTLGFWGVWSTERFLSHILLFSFLYPLWLAAFYVFDWYDLSFPIFSSRFQRYFFGGLLTAFLVGIIFFYSVEFSHITPKTNLLIHVVLFGMLAWFWRWGFFHRISSIATQRIALYGLGEEGKEFESLFASQGHYGYTCVTIDQISLGGLSDEIQRLRPHMIVVPTQGLQGDQIQALYDCLGMGVNFLDLPQAYEMYARHIPLSSVGHQWFILNVQERQHGVYRHIKRAIDVLISSFILLVTLPLWALIALVVKFSDRGPIFYLQERVGQHRKPFWIIKFRTMKPDAEVGGAQWAQENDDRVTRIGRLLRRTHLDELPQMINVVKGDISLVGPRPERPEFIHMLERQIPHYHVRHFIKPGFTGWAQIKFRYARSILDSRKKFEYDLYYLKNRSLIFDQLILLKTIQLLFRKEL